MKRSRLILISGLAAAALAYLGLFHLCTAEHRDMERSQTPELAWLKDEFHLGDAEFKRISALHESYLAGCMERCRRIDSKNAELRQLLAHMKTITPEIERALTEAAQLRAECQKIMLQHCYEVSQTMPPEQGQRYLAWVHQRTMQGDAHSTMNP